MSNKFERYKIINSSSTIDFLIKLQGIQTFIKSKKNEKEYNKLYNKGILQTILGINKIFNKYKLNNEDTSMMFNLIQFYGFEYYSANLNIFYLHCTSIFLKI